MIYEYNKFIEIIEKYDPRDLLNLIILIQSSYCKNDIKKDEYEGIKNLFAKIISFSSSFGKEHINYYDAKLCNSILNIMLSFLTKKYNNDCDDLNKLVCEGKLSQKQMMYEIGCPKTYARIFVETIKAKLIPFENILVNKFQLRLDDLVASLEKMLKYLLKAFSIDDIFAYRIMDITDFFNKHFLDSLLSANEKIDNIENVNAFSKSVCMPIVKIDNRFYLLSVEVFIDNFYLSIHRFIVNNLTKEEKDNLFALKGENFNNICADLFYNKFCFLNAYKNFNYSRGEIDLIVEDSDALFIIECKSRNYTDKVSSKSNAYIKANESNLDFASSQLNRFLSEFESKGTISLHKNNTSLKLIRTKYNYIIPIVLNIANLAEVNVDYSNRDKSMLFFSYDDLQIMADIIEDKKYLFIDFCNQLLENAKKETFVDDCIDMFAFYCQCKNLSMLFNENTNVIIYQLGNDYFQNYFSYATDKNPIFEFDNDISSFNHHCSSFKEMIENYHKLHWKELSDLK